MYFALSSEGFEPHVSFVISLFPIRPELF